MNSHFATPDSGSGRTDRRSVGRLGRTPYISELETEAYLLARDTLRRIQRTSPLVAAISQRTRGGRPTGQSTKPTTP